MTPLSGLLLAMDVPFVRHSTLLTANFESTGCGKRFLSLHPALVHFGPPQVHHKEVRYWWFFQRKHWAELCKQGGRGSACHVSPRTVLQERQSVPLGSHNLTQKQNERVPFTGADLEKGYCSKRDYSVTLSVRFESRYFGRIQRLKMP